MSLITRTLPGIDPQFFAQTQNVALNAYVNLNGTGVVDDNNPYQTGNYYRTLSFSSADNLSGVTIVVNGTGINGDFITENITGPNDVTVFSTQAYSRVTQIQITGAAATNLAVGSGNQAVIPYVFGDRVSKPFSCSQDSYGANITNPDSVLVKVYGTYAPFTKGEILAALASPANGAFSINNSIVTSYWLSSNETRGVAAVYFVITSTSSDSMTLNLWTA